MKLKFNLSLHPFLFLVAFSIFLLPFSLMAEARFGWTVFAYVDETICVLCILFYICYFLKNTRFKVYELLLVTVLLALMLLGFIGNIQSKVIDKWFPVIVDAICLLKIFLPFLVCIKIASRDKDMLVIKYLEPASKLLIIFGSIFGTITQFADIGMNDPERRYGIAPFFFIFQNEGRYGYIIAICLAIVLIVEKDIRKQLIYNVLAVYNMILTTKGVVYVVIVCYIVLALMWRKRSKLSLTNIAVLSVAGVAASTLQINTYLKDFESPRVRLIRYGFVTANKYPFGSGFATYGSDMAMKNYSKLYDLYGFENFYGLSREVSNCLNDCYLGMVVGQFGYLGALLYIALLVMCFIPINKITFNNKIKALCFAIFIGIVVSSIGTAIIKSSIGVMIFMFLGLVCGYSQHISKPERKEA